MRIKKSIFVLIVTVLVMGVVRADDNLGPLEQIKFEGLKGAGFDFLKKGDIYYINADSQHRRFGSLVFYALRGGDVLIPLTDSLSNISFVISSEVNSSDVESFIKNELALFLIRIQVRPGSEILYSNYISGYVSSFGEAVNPLSINVSTNKVLELRKFCSGVAAKVEKDTWQIEFNVITGAGGVEQWRAAGNASPFTITEFTTKILAPRGTFKPEPHMGLITAE